MKWIATVLGFLLVSIIAISVYLQPNDLAQCSERATASAEAKCAPADAIVVVSGGETNARTQHAIDLYNDGWAGYIIFSGAAADKTGPSNAAAMRLYALNAGIPDAAIILEELSENTHENAENTQELLSEYGITDIILTTSGYHQRRAALEFDSFTHGDGVTTRSSPTTDRHWNWWWWATPNGWYLAISELIRIAEFYAQGDAL